ncbi:hypothetical protein C8R48DRAFT_743695 [Suillus tomentosus]|nr:hypothetical protein C8R48DRAFT_743695 [Suillus tomentosus]
MLFRAPSNLRFYIQEARLVKLRAIHPLRLALFNQYRQDYTNSHATAFPEDEDKETGERFTAPCPSFYLSSSVYHCTFCRPNCTRRLFTWTDLLPLETVRRAVHLLYPETKACILNQPPCVLSGRDLDLFCKRQSVWKANHIEAFPVNVMMSPDLWVILDPVAQASSTAHERLCITRSCPWFVVSTYTHWVFGVFLNGWTAAFVSPVYSYDSHDPSVLQLLFWPCSAMGLPGDWVVSAVRIEPAYPSRHLTASASDLAVTDKSTFILWDGYD